MERTTVAKITTSGQVSLPARLRKRWGVAQVLIEDKGDRLEMRPLPDDPIGAACGSLKHGGTRLEAVRASERAQEGVRQRRRKAQ